MNVTAASTGMADSARAVEQLDSTADASLVTLPPARMQVNARGLALGILAALATVFALSWAQSFVIPLLLGIVISYMVNPLVNGLEAIKVPRVGGTVIVIASIISALIFGTYSLRGQMQTIVAQLPEAAATVATGLARMRISDRQFTDNAERRGRGGAGDNSRDRWHRSSASACHSRHRGPALVQTR